MHLYIPSYSRQYAEVSVRLSWDSGEETYIKILGSKIVLSSSVFYIKLLIVRKAQVL